MPNTIMSCNVGTKLFTLDCLHNSCNGTPWTDIRHCQWHVGQDWHTKINFGLNIYHDSSVTNGIDKIVMRHVQIVYWIPLFYVVGRFVCPLKLERDRK